MAVEDHKNDMTLTDAIVAVQSTWDTEIPAPPFVGQGVVQDVVRITSEANRSAGRTMGYGATLAWGIAIGVMAERNRLKRIVTR